MWFSAVKHRPSREKEPAQDCRAAQDRGDRMTKQYGCPGGTPKGREICNNVVDGGDESPIHDMGDSYDDTTRKGHGQKEAHHGRSLAESSPPVPRVGRLIPGSALSTRAKRPLD